jgi:hypothetical protein
MPQTTSEPAQQPARSDQLDHLAEALLERETLDEADAYAVAGIPQPTAVEPPVAASA